MLSRLAETLAHIMDHRVCSIFLASICERPNLERSSAPVIQTMHGAIPTGSNSTSSCLRVCYQNDSHLLAKLLMGSRIFYTYLPCADCLKLIVLQIWPAFAPRYPLLVKFNSRQRALRATINPESPQTAVTRSKLPANRNRSLY